MSDTIGDWITKIKDFFSPGETPTAKPVPKIVKDSPTPMAGSESEIPKDDGTYQAPVKGSWKNSGNFSPGVATDAKHPTGHNGVDIRAPGGTPIYPIAAGIVTAVSFEGDGSNDYGGNSVNVKHRNGVTSYYAHLATVTVKVGQPVTKDTVLGGVGDSGNAKGTWPHCHFQVWKNGSLSNPSAFFSVPPYKNADQAEQKWLPGHQEIAKTWKSQHQKRTASAKISLLCQGCDFYLKMSKL